MPIGVVSNDELEKELVNVTFPVSEKKQPAPVVIEPESPGRKEGDINVPDSLRQLIGGTSKIEGRNEALALANMFGISPSSVSAYAHGSTSTASYDTPTKSIKGHINKRREVIAKKASRKLSMALESITEEKLVDAKVKDLAGIARDMSVIIKNMEPPQESNDNNNNGIQFMIYAPQFRKEDSFDVIHVNE